MKRSYYSTEEAGKATGLSEGDILHLIETDRLSAVLYSKKRRFFVCAKNDESRKHEITGTAEYRGLVKVSKERLLDLIESEVTTITSFSPLEIDKVLNYSNAWPFESDRGPFPKLRWCPREWESLEKTDLYLLALPSESEKLLSVAARLMQESIKTNPDLWKSQTLPSSLLTSNEDIKKTHNYKFEPNWEFNRFDLRILRDSLVDCGLMEALVEASDDETLLWCDTLKVDCLEIDRVIERAFLSLSKPTSKAVWNVICDAHESGTFSFDCDAVIQSVDATTIVWRGKESSNSKNFSSKSLANKLSLIRKAYSQNAQNSG